MSQQPFGFTHPRASKTIADQHHGDDEDRTIQKGQSDGMDHSTRPIAPTTEAASASAASASQSAPNHAVSQMYIAEDLLFPSKLYSMLHDAESNGFDDVVSWGRSEENGCFKVHRKKEFENQILPGYFKMTKYKSFTRQLHNYGFVWIRHGPDKGGCELRCACRL